MKRYKVHMIFHYDQEINLETDTDVSTAPLGHQESGAMLLITQEEHIINIKQVLKRNRYAKWRNEGI